MDEKSEELADSKLKEMGLDPTKLDQSDVEAVNRMASIMKNPQGMNPQEIKKALRKNGIDPAKMIKKMRAGQPPKVGVRKIGRNQPCICESGKKYKKCCGR